MNITTNNVPRLLIDGYDLTPTERAEFDYYRWPDLADGPATGSFDGEDATFFRYRGQLYDIGEFMHADHIDGWDGYHSDSFFSAIVVRFDPDDSDHVVVGLALS